MLDDSTAAYVLATRPHFDNLRDAAAQLAGLLVLEAAGARSAAPDHPMLRSADLLVHESSDGIRRTRSTARARLHHRHLLRAVESIEKALAAAHDGLGRPSRSAELDAVLTPLKAGYAHLQRASNALPGFEIVSFELACCGGGVGSRFQPLPHRGRESMSFSDTGPTGVRRKRHRLPTPGT